MARRRRHYRGLVKFPGLGRLPVVGGGPVKPTDVLVGLGLGVGGSLALQFGANKAIQSGLPIPGFLASGSPVVGGLATAAVLYAAQRKKNRSRAAGHALGAGLAGLAVAAFGIASNLAAGQAPMAGFGAPLFMNPRLRGYGFSPRELPRGMGGPIFNNPRVNLARIGAMQGFGDENEDGMFPAP